MVLDAKHPLMQFENMRNYMLYDLEKDGRRMIGVMALNTGWTECIRSVRVKKYI